MFFFLALTKMLMSHYDLFFCLSLDYVVISLLKHACQGLYMPLQLCVSWTISGETFPRKIMFEEKRCKNVLGNQFNRDQFGFLVLTPKDQVWGLWVLTAAATTTITHTDEQPALSPLQHQTHNAGPYTCHLVTDTSMRNIRHNYRPLFQRTVIIVTFFDFS